MPDVNSIELSDWLIQHTPELCIEINSHRKPLSNGLHLASRFATDLETGLIFDYLPESMFLTVINRSDFARTLVLDKWTCNSDGRQAVFAKHATRSAGYIATFIDQGYCFNAGEWNFPDAPLRGLHARNRVYEGVTGSESFDPWIERIEKRITERVFDDLIREIPPEWYDDDLDAVMRLAEQLYKRRTGVPELLLAAKNTTRHPFPNRM